MDRVKSLIRYACADRLRLRGKGVRIAVLDSGVAPHPDLEGRTILFQDFTKKARVSAYDDCGHGTHISGILAGSGVMSGGRYSGMAPACELVHAKILYADGEGDSSALLRALEWILQIHKKQRVHVLNLSLAVYGLADEQMLLEMSQMLEYVSGKGILVVTAAGNQGPAYGTISQIAQSFRVLTVGCHDFGYTDQKGHSCEMRSGRGSYGLEVRKPDLVAPGTDIHSCAHRPLRAYGGWGYAAKTGTSMSVPIVAGAAALLLEQQPQMSSYMVKRRLQLSTTDLHENYAKQGYGMLNMEKLLTAKV